MTPRSHQRSQSLNLLASVAAGLPQKGSHQVCPLGLIFTFVRRRSKCFAKCFVARKAKVWWSTV